MRHLYDPTCLCFNCCETEKDIQSRLEKKSLLPQTVVKREGDVIFEFPSSNGLKREV